MIKAALRNPYLVSVLALALVVLGTIRAAEEAARLALERYELGAGLAVEVLEAEVSLVRARAAEASAVIDVHRANVALRRATGSI